MIACNNVQHQVEVKLKKNSEIKFEAKWAKIRPKSRFFASFLSLFF